MENVRKVAQEIKAKLDEGNYSFITMDYSELRSIYRRVAGDEARLSKSFREEFQEVLSDYSIKVFPSMEDSGEAVRFFRSGTMLWEIVHNLRYPDNTSDIRLAALIKKVKENPTLLEINIIPR